MVVRKPVVAGIRNPGMATLHKKRRQDDLKSHPTALAGVQGFEPQLADPESAVLPLNDTPRHPTFLCEV